MSILVREHFTQKILDVKHKVLRMGALVENIIETAVTALKTQNLDLAREVCEKDDEIDQLELEIENECMMLLALQQPLAKDLRTIASALKIITDLERMADNAVNIAKVILEIGKEPVIKPLVDIPRMADITQEMIKMSLDAFVNEDIALAEKAAGRDEEVDRLYETVVNDILNIITEKKELAKQGTKLLFIGRYLERIADHSTNICERTIYMIKGELKEIN
jgi:phosphate transport system protein